MRGDPPRVERKVGEAEIEVLLTANGEVCGGNPHAVIMAGIGAARALSVYTPSVRKR